jgi:hypothetical protein
MVGSKAGAASRVPRRAPSCSANPAPSRASGSASTPAARRPRWEGAWTITRADTSDLRGHTPAGRCRRGPASGGGWRGPGGAGRRDRRGRDVGTTEAGRNGSGRGLGPAVPPAGGRRGGNEHGDQDRGESDDHPDPPTAHGTVLEAMVGSSAGATGEGPPLPLGSCRSGCGGERWLLDGVFAEKKRQDPGRRYRCGSALRGVFAIRWPAIWPCPPFPDGTGCSGCSGSFGCLVSLGPLDFPDAWSFSIRAWQ